MPENLWYKNLTVALRACEERRLDPCDKCPFEYGDERCRSLGLDAADAIEELLAKDTNAPSKWVSVEERLPEKYDSVITASKNGDVRWNYLINEKYRTWSHGYHITHWMPLPVPPKGAE